MPTSGYEWIRDWVELPRVDALLDLEGALRRLGGRLTKLTLARAR